MVNRLVSLWCGFRHYFSLDYEIFAFLFYNCLSLRSMAERVITAKASRIYICIPLNQIDMVNQHKIPPHIDSDIIETVDSNDEFVSVKVEGSLNSSWELDNVKASQSKKSNDNIPDIVRTIPPKKLSRKKRSPSSLPTNVNSERGLSRHFNTNDINTDCGFYSDASAHQGNDNSETLKKLEELQAQFCKMQKDIAAFVELCQPKIMAPEYFSPFFNPIMTSSPSVLRGAGGKALPTEIDGSIQLSLSQSFPAPPPPPCMPPPPPPLSTPGMWKKKTGSVDEKTKQKSILRNQPAGLPDMSEVLKGLTSVKLRPVTNNVGSTSKKGSVPFHFNLRPVTKNESIIAAALRERFKQVRMLSDGETEEHNESVTDEWEEDEEEKENENCSYNARLLLRKVDRSQLPSVVSRDLNLREVGDEDGTKEE